MTHLSLTPTLSQRESVLDADWLSLTRNDRQCPLSPGGRELERGGFCAHFHPHPDPLPSREREKTSVWLLCGKSVVS